MWRSAWQATRVYAQQGSVARARLARLRHAGPQRRQQLDRRLQALPVWRRKRGIRCRRRQRRPPPWAKPHLPVPGRKIARRLARRGALDGVSGAACAGLRRGACAWLVSRKRVLLRQPWESAQRPAPSSSGCQLAYEQRRWGACATQAHTCWRPRARGSGAGQRARARKQAPACVRRGVGRGQGRLQGRHRQVCR